MAKNQTQWASSTKNNASWALVTRNGSTWSNNITKVAATYTVVPRNTDQWNINYQSAQTYAYDDANITYDSPIYQYDFIVNSNTLNQVNQTPWVAV